MFRQETRRAMRKIMKLQKEEAKQEEEDAQENGSKQDSKRHSFNDADALAELGLIDGAPPSRVGGFLPVTAPRADTCKGFTDPFLVNRTNIFFLFSKN